MRAFAAAGSALATLGFLLALGPHARADNDCQLAFEKWAKISSSRIVPKSATGSGACIPNEAARSDLLEGLARARAICSESPADQQQTKTLISINQTFVTSLGICGPGPAPIARESPDSAGGRENWAAKPTPSEDKPKVAAPPPAPPPPKSVAATPPPAAPKPVLPAPVPASPSAVAPAQVPAPPCLEMTPAPNNSYALVNRRCRGHTVLAVIETRGTAGETECRGYSISQSMAVRALGASPPRVNYECVASQGPCNKERLGDMFPECDW